MRRRIFRWTAYLVVAAVVIGILTFCAGFVMVDADEVTNIYQPIVMLIWLGVLPLSSMLLAATGLGMLREEQRSKRKRDTLSYSADDDRMNRILRKLSSDERNYIESRLEASRLGLSNDGELMSLNELLDDDDHRLMQG